MVVVGLVIWAQAPSFFQLAKVRAEGDCSCSSGFSGRRRRRRRRGWRWSNRLGYRYTVLFGVFGFVGHRSNRETEVAVAVAAVAVASVTVPPVRSP